MGTDEQNTRVNDILQLLFFGNNAKDIQEFRKNIRHINFGEINPSRNRHEDAEQYYNALLGHLEVKPFISEEKTIPFRDASKYKVKGKQLPPSYLLPLALDPSASKSSRMNIRDLIAKHQSDEVMEDKVDFDKVGGGTERIHAKKKINIIVDSSIKTLDIQLKRSNFDRSNGSITKNTQPVCLDWIRVQNELRQDDDFQIRSFATHIGENVNSGHYIAYLHTQTGWIKCDDDKITDVSYDEINDLINGNSSRETPYILCYRRKDGKELPEKKYFEGICNTGASCFEAASLQVLRYKLLTEYPEKTLEAKKAFQLKSSEASQVAGQASSSEASQVAGPASSSEASPVAGLRQSTTITTIESLIKECGRINQTINAALGRAGQASSSKASSEAGQASSSEASPVADPASSSEASPVAGQASSSEAGPEAVPKAGPASRPVARSVAVPEQSKQTTDIQSLIKQCDEINTRINKALGRTTSNTTQTLKPSSVAGQASRSEAGSKAVPASRPVAISKADQASSPASRPEAGPASSSVAEPVAGPASSSVAEPVAVPASSSASRPEAGPEQSKQTTDIEKLMEKCDEINRRIDAALGRTTSNTTQTLDPSSKAVPASSSEASSEAGPKAGQASRPVASSEAVPASRPVAISKADPEAGPEAVPASSSEAGLDIQSLIEKCKKISQKIDEALGTTHTARLEQSRKQTSNHLLI